MTESRTPLSSGTDHGRAPIQPDTTCNCIQCKLTSLFKQLSVLHVVADDADALLEVMDGMYAIIRDTGMVYRVEPCPAVSMAVKEIDAIAHELTGMNIGARLKTAVKRLQEISL